MWYYSFVNNQENIYAVPVRADVPSEHTWNLRSLYASGDEWADDMRVYERQVEQIAGYRDKLGETASVLAEFLELYHNIQQKQEKLGYYAMLRYSEDAGDSDNQARYGKALQIFSRIGAELSFVVPEIQRIPDDTMEKFLHDRQLKENEIFLRKLLRWKPHILPAEQERLLALQEEANQSASKAFEALVDVDFDFGTIDTPDGRKPLTQASFGVFMLDPNRELRRTAYQQLFAKFDEHKNTLAALYSGSIALDLYQAKVRNFPTARSRALFPDRIPDTVYDTLIQTVRDNLSQLHRYYRLRRKVLQLDAMHMYDLRAPLLPEIKLRYTYEEAVDVISAALRPLGSDYVETMRSGLLGDWVDRYENRGKRSGAFSAGSYNGDPYILLNYQEDDIRSLFTIAHEAGHSMHSYYSTRNNPFQHYQYTIFEAEVASTVNEQLLADYLYRDTSDADTRAYLVLKRIEDIIATLFRQTMFAEYEHTMHALTEGGTPITLDLLRGEYRELLEAYFGDSTVIDEQSDLEGLRIPHFYRAFYVYKYATGISAALSISRNILKGGQQALADYRRFLKSGGSRYPLETLALTGLDMEQPLVVNSAMEVIKELIDQLERHFS